MVPTDLGRALIEGFLSADALLCEAGIRAAIEQQVGLVAAGTATPRAVLDASLALYLNRYVQFRIDVVRAKFLSDRAMAGLARSPAVTAAAPPAGRGGGHRRRPVRPSQRAQPSSLHCR